MHITLDSGTAATAGTVATAATARTVATAATVGSLPRYAPRAVSEGLCEKGCVRGAL